MSNLKTIWVINMFAGSPQSGWGERHYYLAQKWRAHGYAVTIVSSTYNHMFQHFAKDENTFNFEEVNGIRFCWVKTPSYKATSILRFWAMLVFAFKAFFVPVARAGKPHSIIVSSMPIFPTVTGWLLKKRYKASKFIFEIRDLWPLTPMYLLGYSKWHPVIIFIRFFETLGYKKSDYIVSLLPNAYKHIDKISKEPKKFRYIPNGSDEQTILTEPLESPVQELIPQNKFMIAYTGTLSFANAMEFLMEATHIIKEESIHFLIVGDGYKVSELKEKSNKKNTTFISKIPKSQVQTLLQHASVCYVGRYASPLYKYGVSYNKYFDYMLAKKPVLESSELIKDNVELSGCGIIVPPENAQAIADGIMQLYAMSAKEREAMGMKGYEYVKKYHSFEYLSRQYETLFHD